MSRRHAPSPRRPARARARAHARGATGRPRGAGCGRRRRTRPRRRPRCGVAEDDGGLIGREQGAVELVERGRVRHRSAAQLRDALPLGRAESCHRSQAMGERRLPRSRARRQARAGDAAQPWSSGKRSRASWVDCATTRPRLSHRTQVSSTMPSATRLAVHADAEPARRRARRGRTPTSAASGTQPRRADHERGRRNGVDREEQGERVGLPSVGEARPPSQLRPGILRRGCVGEGERVADRAGGRGRP